jgi:peptidoglycan/xylan/chitin deacetylase (PgdA/CDA1 family)
MDRDFIGYGRTPPKVQWPGKARIAVSLVVNIEEGYKEYPKALPPGVRDYANESAYEYGTRAGFWRIRRLLERYDVPVTYFCCAMALERQPELAGAIAASEDEVCSHGYRWEEPFTKSQEDERASIAQAVASLQRTTGRRPLGWYSRYAPSAHTRRLLMEEGGFVYDCDSYADDLPFYVREGGRPFLVVPYTLETNDVKFWTSGAFGHGEDFYRYMKDSLDLLYEEGAESPRMMSVGLHLRISGRPGRARALERFLTYARSLDKVWFARRIDIARHWLEHHPPPAR